MYICAYIYIYICICIYVNKYTYIHIYIYIHSSYIYIYVYALHMYIYIYMYVCLYIYIYIIYIYIYIYIYIEEQFAILPRRLHIWLFVALSAVGVLAACLWERQGVKDIIIIMISSSSSSSSSSIVLVTMINLACLLSRTQSTQPILYSGSPRRRRSTRVRRAARSSWPPKPRPITSCSQRP